MTIPTLRPYQRELVDGIEAQWDAGARNVLGVLATGGGKSVCLTHIVRELPGVTCAIAHRQELVSQLSGHFARSRIEHRLIAPKPVIARISAEHRAEFGRSWHNPTAAAAVAGVDTLVSKSRQSILKPWARQVSTWIIDEAAHVLRENKWGRAASMFVNARGLGVTATPCRADGNGLGSHAEGVFDCMVIGPDTRALIGMDMLTDYEIVLPESDMDVESLRVTASGDYSPTQMKMAAEKSRIVGDVVANYLIWANGTRAVAFATDVATAETMAERFRQSGVTAACVSGETPDAERGRMVKAFRDGSISVLVNVDIFDEGFDLPAIETVIMARPTQSLGKYLQMVGRGLRPMPGKTRALIIDHVSNVKRHGLPDRPRRWTLDSRDRRASVKRDPDEIPVTHCMECLHAYERIHRACPFCGHEPEPAGRSLPEQVDGDLTLLDKATLDRLRAETQLETPDSVRSRAAHVAGPAAGAGAAARQRERIETQRQLSEAIALWAGHQRAQGRSDSESYRRWWHWMGMSVPEALALPRKEMQSILTELSDGGYGPGE